MMPAIAADAASHAADAASFTPLIRFRHYAFTLRFRFSELIAASEFCCHH
jgi:hypothetical protein